MDTAWNSMELHGPSMELYGTPQTLHGVAMEFHRITWNSMEFHGIHIRVVSYTGLQYTNGVPCSLSERARGL